MNNNRYSSTPLLQAKEKPLFYIFENELNFSVLKLPSKQCSFNFQSLKTHHLPVGPHTLLWNTLNKPVAGLLDEACVRWGLKLQGPLHSTELKIKTSAQLFQLVLMTPSFLLVWIERDKRWQSHEGNGDGDHSSHGQWTQQRSHKEGKQQGRLLETRLNLSLSPTSVLLQVTHKFTSGPRVVDLLDIT